MALPRAIPLAPLHESYENRINYQQQQIQDLTEQCKSLRSQLSRQAGETMELEQTLDAQQQQAKTAIKALQEKLRTEKKVHKDHDEKRNRVARIASLSLQRELCDRHLEEVRLHDIIRQETIATIVREFKITQFAIAEQQKDKILRDTERDLSKLERQNDKLRAHNAILDAEKGEEMSHVERLQEENLELQKQLEELEAISSDLVKSQKSTAGHSETIKHLTLELEAVKKENTTLTGQLEKLKRTNTELKSQLENLKKLEGKNEKDSRVVVALEAEKGELEARVTEMEAADRANVKEMKRLRKEISSLKEELGTVQDELENAAEAKEQAQIALHENRAASAELRRRISELEQQTRESQHSGSSGTHKKPPRNAHNETEVEEPRPAPFKRPAPPRAKGKERAAQVEEEPKDDVEGTQQTPPKKPRSKAKERPVDDAVPTKRHPKSKGEDEQHAKRKAQEGDQDEDEVKPKKAKRKLDLGYNADPATAFNWGASTQGGENASVIPTQLSPIKESSTGVARTNSLLGRLTSNLW